MPCIFRMCPDGYLLFIFCMIVCIRQIKKSCFTDGVPIQSTMVLTNKSFYAAERLMALSLIQGGPEPCTFIGKFLQVY